MFACGNDMLPEASTVPVNVPVKGPTVEGAPVTVSWKFMAETVSVIGPAGSTFAVAANAEPAGIAMSTAPPTIKSADNRRAERRR